MYDLLINADGPFQLLLLRSQRSLMLLNLAMPLDPLLLRLHLLGSHPSDRQPLAFK